MTTPTDDQLAAAAQKARADHETAREIAARLLAPPDPIDILAGVIADRGEVADERDELRAERDALTADLDAIRGMVGRYGHGVTAVEAVRALVAAHGEARVAAREASTVLKAAESDAAERERLRADLDAIHGMVGRPTAPIVEAVRQALDERDTANWHIGQIAEALGLLECAPAVMVRARAGNLCAERDALTKLKDRVHDMTANAEIRERTIKDLIGGRDNLRAALDRVAAEVGVEIDSTGAIVADRVIDAIRRLSRDRDQVRVARKDATEEVERLNAILSSAGVDITGTAAEVADRVAAALRRPALPADLRAYLDARRDRLVDVSGLSAASEIAALTGWIASPTAEVTK